LVTPSDAAVPGMSWVRPTAPAPLRALGLKPDSCETRPFSSAGSIPLPAAAALISASKLVSPPAPATGADDWELCAAARAPAKDDDVAAGAAAGAVSCETIALISSSRVPIVAMLMTRASGCGR
jgi:hypothetical protein